MQQARPSCPAPPASDVRKLASAAVTTTVIGATPERRLRSMADGKDLPAHRVEARLLVVAERIVEILERRLDRLHRLEHGAEPFADGVEPARRRARLLARAGGLDDIGGLRRGRLQGFE